MKLVFAAPFKSVAAALVLSVLFGPLGLFYSSLIGGIVMTLLALFASGMVVSQQSPFPMMTVWLLSLVWAMCSVRFYNRKLWKEVIGFSKEPTVQSSPVLNPKHEA